MSPVDDLREAAKLLRERAQQAAEGPWVADGWEIRSGQVQGEWVGETLDIDDEPQSESNSTYAASMHPLVGLALADVFETRCVIYDIRTASGAAEVAGTDMVLRLARLYLGRPK